MQEALELYDIQTAVTDPRPGVKDTPYLLIAFPTVCPLFVCSGGSSPKIGHGNQLLWVIFPDNCM